MSAMSISARVRRSRTERRRDRGFPGPLRRQPCDAASKVAIVCVIGAAAGILSLLLLPQCSRRETDNRPVCLNARWPAPSPTGMIHLSPVPGLIRLECEKLPHRHLQCLSHGVDVLEGGIPASSLDAGYISHMKTGAMRNLLLRQPAEVAQIAYMPSECQLKVVHLTRTLSAD